MKEVKMSEKAASLIENLRDCQRGHYESELQRILESVEGLNDIICMARDSEEISELTDIAQRAMTTTLDYYHLIKELYYTNDFRQDAKIVVQQPE